MSMLKSFLFIFIRILNIHHHEIILKHIYFMKEHLQINYLYLILQISQSQNFTIFY